MKQDEKALLFAMVEAAVDGDRMYDGEAEGEGVVFARDLGKALEMPWKRVAFLCGKWRKKGWYEYGVSVDLGWLTDEGHKVAKELRRDSESEETV